MGVPDICYIYFALSYFLGPHYCASIFATSITGKILAPEARHKSFTWWFLGTTISSSYEMAVACVMGQSNIPIHI